MDVKRIIKLWLVVSVMAIGGLTLFHRFVEDKTPLRSVTDASKEYGTAMKWLAERAIEAREMRP
ncbi:MAG: hypothetical protein ABEJ58_10330 [Halodesulfurarchaeum sp.]